MITTNERKLFVKALRLAKNLDDACPDVGMGPFLETLLDQVAASVGMELSVAEVAGIINDYGLKYGSGE